MAAVPAERGRMTPAHPQLGREASERTREPSGKERVRRVIGGVGPGDGEGIDGELEEKRDGEAKTLR